MKSFFFCLYFFFVFISLSFAWDPRINTGGRKSRQALLDMSSMSAGERLFLATRYGRVEEAEGILRDTAHLNVNWKDEHGWTSLIWGCVLGHDSIVAILLAYPGIDVSQKTNDGFTPFMYACGNGKTPCVRLFLKDSRVKVNEPGKDGSTPLKEAALHGHLDTIKWWIASGREMVLGESGNGKTDAIGAAKNPPDKGSFESEKDFLERKKRCVEVVTLLERFKSDATKTRSEVRKELEITGQSTPPFILHSFFDPPHSLTSFFFCNLDTPEETRHTMRVVVGLYDEAALVSTTATPQSQSPAKTSPQPTAATPAVVTPQPDSPAQQPAPPPGPTQKEKDAFPDGKPLSAAATLVSTPVPKSITPA